MKYVVGNKEHDPGEAPVYTMAHFDKNVISHSTQGDIKAKEMFFFFKFWKIGTRWGFFFGYFLFSILRYYKYYLSSTKQLIQTTITFIVGGSHFWDVGKDIF